MDGTSSAVHEKGRRPDPGRDGAPKDVLTRQTPRCYLQALFFPE